MREDGMIEAIDVIRMLVDNLVIVAEHNGRLAEEKRQVRDELRNMRQQLTDVSNAYVDALHELDEEEDE